MWGDPSVLVWGKGALEANRSVQEIQSDLSVLWLPSRNHLKIGEFNERLVASAVTQNYKQIEADSTMQCKNKEVNIVKKFGTIYNTGYKK